MEGNNTGAGLGKLRHQAIYRLNHQMHIDGRGNTIVTQRLTHHRPDRQIRHIVIVHHIKVHYVSTGGQYLVHIFAQTGKIG